MAGNGEHRPLLTKFSETSTIIGELTLVIAALIAFVQYRQAVQQDRVERVLDLVKEFDSGELLKAQQRLAAALKKGVLEVNTVVGDRATAVAAIERELIDKILADSSEDGLASSMSLIVGFMDKLKACTDSSVCDPVLAHKYFASYATGLARSFGCYIVAQRQGDPGYAKGLLTIAQSPAFVLSDNRRCGYLLDRPGGWRDGTKAGGLGGNTTGSAR